MGQREGTRRVFDCLRQARVRAVWLIVFTLSILLPSFVGGSPPGIAGTTPVPVCTAEGVRWMRMASPESPSPGSPVHGCLWCLLAGPGGLAAGEAGDPLILTFLRHASPPAEPVAPSWRPAWPGFIPRAPPSLTRPAPSLTV